MQQALKHCSNGWEHLRAGWVKHWETRVPDTSLCAAEHPRLLCFALRWREGHYKQENCVCVYLRVLERIYRRVVCKIFGRLGSWCHPIKAQNSWYYPREWGTYKNIIDTGCQGNRTSKGLTSGDWILLQDVQETWKNSTDLINIFPEVCYSSDWEHFRNWIILDNCFYSKTARADRSKNLAACAISEWCHNTMPSQYHHCFNSFYGPDFLNCFHRPFPSLFSPH